MVHDYKTELEERYPLSCSACEERMELYLASERKFLLSSLQKEALGRSRGMTSVGSVPRWSFGKGVGWSLGIGVLILWRVVCLGLFIWSMCIVVHVCWVTTLFTLNSRHLPSKRTLCLERVVSVFEWRFDMAQVLTSKCNISLDAKHADYTLGNGLPDQSFSPSVLVLSGALKKGRRL